MDFNGTSTNITELLVVALVVTSVILLMRKRYDSNLPLLSYFVVIAFTNIVEGRSLNPFLLYSGLGLALILRFEFMGGGFMKFVAYMTTGAMCVITWIMVSDVLYS